jgi:hypothetical protein
VAQPPLLETGVPASEPASFLLLPESAAQSPQPASPPLPDSQVFVFMLQTGVGSLQSELFVHMTHDPPEQTSPDGLPAQSPLTWHAAHVFPDPHVGSGFLHSALLEHVHVWVDVSHVPDVQSELFWHCTQAPLEVSHRSGAHCASEVHAMQADPLQIGVLPEHSEFSEQPRHVSVSVAQIGASAGHWDDAVHWTH